MVKTQYYNPQTFLGKSAKAFGGYNYKLLKNYTK